MDLLFTAEGWGLLAGTLVSGSLLAIGHWFPWLNGELTRIQAYIYGTASIWAGVAVWRGLFGGEWLTPLGLLLIDIVAGLVVIGAYRWDAWVQDARESRVAKQKLAELDRRVEDLLNGQDPTLE